jgi:ketosteroid isomerase-like protein
MDPELRLEMFLGLGTYRGREAIRDATKAWRESLPNWRIELEEWIDAGDGEFVAVTVGSGSGGASGVAIEQRAAQTWVIRRGLALRAHYWETKDQALEAAGLSD